MNTQVQKRPQQERNGEPHWRYERKFTAYGESLASVLSVVRRHPAAFREVYSPRTINNIYLDSPSLHDYHEHVSGVSDRVKTRIRWYGPLRGPIDKPVLERKIKRGLVNGKSSYPLPALHFNGSIDGRILASSLDRAALPELLRSRLHHLQPALINRYRRHYLQSSDGLYRLTVDAHLEFCSPRVPSWSTVLSDRDMIIIELKFDPRQAEQVGSITNTFRFRLNRCSKYVLGIERLHGA